MKTVIFSDLHQPPAPILSAIENTIAQENPDRIVFLGDYFDQFGDSPDDARRVAGWLKQSLADSRRTHLIGNHDASYLWPCEATFCPGFTWEKEKAIRLILRKNSEQLFVFYTWVDGWLLTHAGLSAIWVPDNITTDTIDLWLGGEDAAARAQFSNNKSHWFLSIGPKRGGAARAGSAVV